MNGPLLDSGSARQVVVAARGPIGGDQVGVPASVAPGYGVLTCHDTTVERIGVRLHPFAEIPEGHLVLGQDTADEIGLAKTGSRWALYAAEPADLKRIRIEVPAGEADEAVTAVAAAGFAGRVLWWAADARECRLMVGDLPSRVTRPDAGRHGDGLARLTEHTEVEIFAPGTRTGIDVVILADLTGSMSVYDIQVPGRLGTKRLTRLKAMQHALLRLLDARLRADLRTSRLALLGFANTTTPWFPERGGMVELTRSSPQEIVREFQSAVAGLTLQEGTGTNISGALHDAANLLYRRGRPGNEKLIVLVSDGAEYRVRTDEEVTGKVVPAHDDPVTLIAHLFDQTRVRLHTVGISTPAAYQRWLHDKKMAPVREYEPNHELLDRLIQVGGGGSAGACGTDEIEELAAYFAGLGAGVTRTIHLKPQPSARRALPPETAKELSIKVAQHARSAAAAGRAQMAPRMGELAVECNRAVWRLCGSRTASLFDPLAVKRTIAKIQRAAAPDGRPVDKVFGELVAALGDFVPQPVPDGADYRLEHAHQELAGYLQALRAFRNGRPDYAAVGRVVGNPSIRNAEQAIDECLQGFGARLERLLEVLKQHPQIRMSSHGQAAPTTVTIRDRPGPVHPKDRPGPVHPEPAAAPPKAVRLQREETLPPRRRQAAHPPRDETARPRPRRNRS